MTDGSWQWHLAPQEHEHRDRTALLREIDFETTAPIAIDEQHPLDESARLGKRGKGLSLDISSGGMLLLMDWAPEPDQVIRATVPPVAHDVRTPILAEVRWVRTVPFPRHQDLYFVGVKFLF